MSFKAVVCGMEYHNIDGTGWPDAVVVDNGGDIFEHAYETRTYFLVDRNALLALADEMKRKAQEYVERFDENSSTASMLNGYASRIREALGCEKTERQLQG